MANKYAGTQTEKNLREAFFRRIRRREINIPILHPRQKEGFEQISALF